MAHVVHGSHFGLSLVLKAHLVGFNLHVATACSTHEQSVCPSYTRQHGQNIPYTYSRALVEQLLQPVLHAKS